MFNTITALRIKISSYKYQHCGHVESVKKLKSVRCLAVCLAVELRNFSSSCSCLRARTPNTMLFFWFVTTCRYKERRLILRFLIGWACGLLVDLMMEAGHLHLRNAVLFIRGDRHLHIFGNFALLFRLMIQECDLGVFEDTTLSVTLRN